MCRRLSPERKSVNFVAGLSATGDEAEWHVGDNVNVNNSSVCGVGKPRLSYQKTPRRRAVARAMLN